MKLTPVELYPGKGPGQWTRIVIDEFGDSPRWGAMIVCPGECGRHLAVINHAIDPMTGQVTPSVGHPSTYPACSWHVTPKLIGWGPCPPPPPPRPLLDPCVQCGARSRQLGGWGIANGGLHCPECMRKILVKP